MKRVVKNPRVTDAQRDKNLKRRALEGRAEVDNLLITKGATTQAQVLADYLEDKTTEEHITYRLLQGIFFGLKNTKYYPQTKEEKYNEIVSKSRLMQKICEIRRDKNFQYLSIVTGVQHIDPYTGDLENVICNAVKETAKKAKIILQSFRHDRSQFIDTYTDATVKTLVNGDRKEIERRKLAREELERRRRRNKQ